MASSGFDFSDLGGRIVQGAKNLVTTGDTTGNPNATNAKAAAELANQEADLKTRDQLYQTDPQAYKQQHPLDYATRKAHDFLSNAIVQPVLRNTPTSIRAAAEPKIRAVADAGLAAYGMPTGKQPSVIQQGVVARGLDPEEIEAIGGRTIQKAPIPQPVENDGWITEDGYLQNPKGKSHKDTAAGGDTQEAIKNGHIRVATLGTPGDTLHFEARDYGNPDTRKRIADAIRSSPKAQNISMEFTEPEKYKNVTATPESALSWLEAHGGTSGAPPAVKPGGANYQDAAKYLGIEFRGVQEGVKGVHPGVAIFQDPQSGTSVALRLDQWSPDKLLSKLRAARESMKK